MLHYLNFLNFYVLCTLYFGIKIFFKSLILKKIIPDPKLKYLFISGTNNQKRVLEPVYKRFNEANVTQKKLINVDLQTYLRIPTKIIFKTFLKESISVYSKKSHYIKYSKEKIIQQFYMALCKSFWLYFFKNHSCKFVVMSNCHNITQVIVIEVAKELGIHTIYFQHSLITSELGILKADFNLLSGIHSYNKYMANAAKINSNEQPIACIGVGLITELRCNNKSPPPKFTIGLALSVSDVIDKFIVTLGQLISEGYHVRLRLHPRESKQRKMRIINFTNQLDSNKFSYYEENITDFFNKISILISCQSAIALEARLFGINCYCVNWFQNDFEDRYDFVKNEISFFYKNINNVNWYQKSKIKHLKEKNDDNIRLYSATFGTDWQGREIDITVNCINAIKKHLETKMSQQPKYSK